MRVPRDVLKILLVDDDAACLAMLGLSLRREGFRVVTAASAERALAILARSRYDWLVTDYRMAGMGGAELAVRAARLRPGIRTVLVSADCPAERLLECPAERLFAKPVAVDELAAWLRSGGAAERPAS